MDATLNMLTAPLEEILVSGGDSRSAIDQRTGLNSVGCRPSPRPDALSFGSSTASSISNRAFSHLEEERGRFMARLSNDAFLEEQTEALRSELRLLLGLRHAEADIVFSPSGTDSTLHGLCIARALSRTPCLDAVLVASDETGSGVPNALSGRHFNTTTAEGVKVRRGEPIAGLAGGVELHAVSIRDRDFLLLPAAESDRLVYDRVAKSISAGRSVLLQVMDSSKLGVRAPSVRCLQRIADDFRDRVHVVIDACQMRTSATRIREHLAQGRMVLISGSKFFTGPPFSGALLVPSGMSANLNDVREIAPGLFDYTGRSSWPIAWRLIRARLPDRANLGQYFRWTAAIDEMQSYFSVPMEFRCSVLDRFADLASGLIRGHDARFHLMDDSRPSPDDPERDEMGVRTIFPFLLRQGASWLPFDDAAVIFGALNVDVTTRLPELSSVHERDLASKPCHIGQPVAVSKILRGRAGSLRICASARTVSNVWARYQTDPHALSLDRERNEIRTVLDKTALALRFLPSLLGARANSDHQAVKAERIAA